MESLFGVVAVLLLLAMIGTVVVLFIGVFSMGRRGRVFSPTFSNKMMRLRVILQAFAVLMVGILLLSLVLR